VKASLSIDLYQNQTYIGLLTKVTMPLSHANMAVADVTHVLFLIFRFGIRRYSTLVCTAINAGIKDKMKAQNQSK
jgi:hypothetical protein